MCVQCFHYFLCFYNISQNKNQYPFREESALYMLWGALFSFIVEMHCPPSCIYKQKALCTCLETLRPWVLENIFVDGMFQRYSVQATRILEEEGKYWSFCLLKYRAVANLAFLLQEESFESQKALLWCHFFLWLYLALLLHLFSSFGFLTLLAIHTLKINLPHSWCGFFSSSVW